MKLITLNIWGGIAYKPLMKFIKQQGRSVDIFCFQEVFDTVGAKKTSGKARANLFQELQKALPKHRGFFAPAISGYDLDGRLAADLSFGLAVFVRQNIKIKKTGEILVYGGKIVKAQHIGYMPRNLFYALIKKSGKKYLVANMHGLWDGGPKTDSPDRIQQSKKAKALLDKFNCPKLICGDFNLLPNTNSIGILGKGMVNLIKKYKIKSTRTWLYRHRKIHPCFADYIIVSRDIKVKNFKVLKNVVSDHAPLAVEFN